MDLMVEGDVVEEPGLVPLPDGHRSPAEDAGHCVWLCEVVKHHLVNYNELNYECKINFIFLKHIEKYQNERICTGQILKFSGAAMQIVW